MGVDTMRGLFWLVGLFAAAVALALLMGQNDATVTLFWTPHRVDVSFNLVLAVVLLAFVLVHLALRSVAVLRALPGQAQRWRHLQRERQVHASLADALSHQLAGRFVRARGAARTGIDLLMADTSGASGARHEQQLVLAHLLAAEAAQSLQDRELRDQHLKAALAPVRHADAVPAREGALLRAIRWAVEDRNLEAASHWLGQLPQGMTRRTLALRLKLRVARLAQDHQMALETARLLVKHRAFSPQASRSLIRGLFLAALQGAHDTEQVRAVWQGLDSSDRRDPDLLLAMARRLHAVHAANGPGVGAEAGEWPSEQAAVQGALREKLVPVWEAWDDLSPASRQDLVELLHATLDGLDPVWLERVETLQRQQPADPLLQYLAAEVFFQQGLWGKATLLFQQAVHGLSDSRLTRRGWIRLAELAQRRDDAVAATQAWREAALTGLSTQNHKKKETP
jgi:HemY protein